MRIVDAMRTIPRADVPDLPDRIVAATGIYFGVPIISRDGRIRAANLQTVNLYRSQHLSDFQKYLYLPSSPLLTACSSPRKTPHPVRVHSSLAVVFSRKEDSP